LKYINYIQTGSGSDSIEVEIDRDAVEISIRRHWMGSGLKRYRLTCRRHELSTSFGLFVVERVESAFGKDTPFEVVTLDEAEMLLPLVIEYVIVPQSPVFVHDASAIAGMRPMGYATWNDEFDLVLMVHDIEGRTEQEPVADICYTIDKKKLVAWSEAAQARQSARAEADGERSLANWRSVLGGRQE
jgi:hypothetical protein